MEGTAIAALVARAIAGQAVGSAVRAAGGVVRRVRDDDPEVAALAEAVAAAHDATPEADLATWAAHGVDLRTFELEAARELAPLLVGRMPNEVAMAGALVDSLTPGLELDERWRRIERLQGSCRAFAMRLRDEAARRAPLQSRVPPPPEDRTWSRAAYLRWVTRHLRFVETTGIGTTAGLSVPLSDVFVTVRAAPRDRERRWRDAHREEVERLEALAREHADAVEIEAALDRLGAAGRVGAPDHDHGEPTPPIDAIGVIEANPRLVIIGQPGSGKTTVLRYLALQNARALLGDSRARDAVRRPRLPVFVSIADFMASGEQGLRTFLARAPALRGYSGPPVDALFDEAIEDEGVIVLLDGLDEVGTADRRAMSTKAITDLANSLDDTAAHVVVTTRPSGYEAAPLSNRFRHVEVHDMEDGDISRFLDGYLPAIVEASPPTDGGGAAAEIARSKAELLEAMAKNPGIRRLAGNPLLLTAIVLVHRSTGRLPASRIEAYEQIDAALTDTWRRHTSAHAGPRPDPDDVRLWLRVLAAWMHEHRPERSASWRDLVEVLGPRWCEMSGHPWDPLVLDGGDLWASVVGRGVREAVEEIARHTGLLVERAPGRWGFPHLTFQEYHHARSLIYGHPPAQRPAAIRALLHQPQHVEVVLLALALMAREAERDDDRWDDFAAAVLGVSRPGDDAPSQPSPYEAQLGRDHLFAVRALGDDLDLPVARVASFLRDRTDELAERTGRGWSQPYRSYLRHLLDGLRPTRFGPALAAIVDDVASRPLANGAALDLAGIRPVGSRLADQLVAIARGPGITGAPRALSVLRTVELAPHQVDALVELVANPAYDNAQADMASFALAAGPTVGPASVVIMRRIVLDEAEPLVRRIRAARVIATSAPGPDGEVTALLRDLVAGRDAGDRDVMAAVEVLCLSGCGREASSTVRERVVGSPDRGRFLRLPGLLTPAAAPTTRRAMVDVALAPDVPTEVVLDVAWMVGGEPALADELCPRLRRVVLDPNVPALRVCEAADMVARRAPLGAEEVQILTAIVQDGEPSEVVAAARALVTRGPLAPGLDAILRGVVYGDRGIPRYRAIDVLAANVAAGGEAGAHDLLTFLQRPHVDPDLTVDAGRVVAAEIGMVNGLIDVLETVDRSGAAAADVRRKLVELLGPEVLSIDDLLATLETDPGATVRRAAAAILVRRARRDPDLMERLVAGSGQGVGAPHVLGDGPTAGEVLHDALYDELVLLRS